MPEEGLDRFMTVFPGCEEIGTFMALVGTVVKVLNTGSNVILEYKREYRCSKCKHIMLVEAPLSRFNAFPRSLDKCENLCMGAKVEPFERSTDEADCRRFRNYQEIKIQVNTFFEFRKRLKD